MGFEQTFDSDIVGNHIVRNQQVTPWFPTMGKLGRRCMKALAGSCTCLGIHGGIPELIRSLGFAKQLFGSFFSHAGRVIGCMPMSMGDNLTRKIDLARNEA